MTGEIYFYLKEVSVVVTDTKTYKGREDKYPRIQDVCMGWKWVVRFDAESVSRQKE
jgi:hypothetical protein